MVDYSNLKRERPKEEERKKIKEEELSRDGGKLRKEIRKRNFVKGAIGLASAAVVYFGVFPFIKKPLINSLRTAKEEITEKIKQYNKQGIKLDKTKEELGLAEKEKQKVIREKTALEATYKKEKAEMIKQYLGSELKGEYDSKIGYNTFDLVLMPSDENYSYFWLKVKKTNKLQLNPENKALGAAVEDYFSRLVEFGVITKKEQKNIMINGGMGEYEFADGEALLKIKQKGLVYQDYLTPDKRESLEKKIFSE